MDFVTVREFRTQPGKVWEKLEKEKELVITRNGKPFALLTFTESNRVEENLRAIRQARAEQALSKIWKRSEKLGKDKMTREEINAEIAATRKERRSRQKTAGA